MMLKTQSIGAASAVLLTIGVLTIGATAASAAAKPAVTPGHGSSVTCTFSAKAKLSPALKNDWTPSDYSNDPDAAVRNAPFVAFAQASPVTTTAKGKSLSCSGTVVDATTHLAYPVTSMKLQSISTTVGTPPHADCAGLASPPSGTTFTSTLNWKLSGATMLTPTVITSSLANLIDSHGIGFLLTATGITGPFAGGSSVVNAYLDGATLTAITALPGSSTAASSSPCWPRMKIIPATAKKAELVKQLHGKGLKKINLGGGVFDNSPSSLTISLP